MHNIASQQKQQVCTKRKWYLGIVKYLVHKVHFWIEPHACNLC